MFCSTADGGAGKTIFADRKCVVITAIEPGDDHTLVRALPRHPKLLLYLCVSANDIRQ